MLFDPFDLGPFRLENRVVMAPMTRNRATADHTPTPLMATYYGQRSGMGLIITEGTAPSPNGAGYPRIPGIWNHEQAKAWRPVTEAVHQRGGRIVVQLMHTGRVSHTANLPSGAEVLGPVAHAMPGEMYTDEDGPQPHSRARAMEEDDIREAIDEFVTASRLAMDAGFDGVELHGANGYLLEQFLNATVNTRTDAWGGSPEARNRLTLEVAAAVVEEIGADRTGIRLSPYGAFNDTGAFDGVDEQYVALARQLGELGLLWLHMVDHSSMGSPEVPESIKDDLRDAFGGTWIASGGFDKTRAQKVLAEGEADLVAFGRPALANPDLVRRMEEGIELNEPDPDTFYTPGETGYTDYPTTDS